jgi:hypothetical protein
MAIRRPYLPTRNPADARKHETNLQLTKAASAESDDVTRNSYSGFGMRSAARHP